MDYITIDNAFSSAQDVPETTKNIST